MALVTVEAEVFLDEFSDQEIIDEVISRGLLDRLPLNEVFKEIVENKGVKIIKMSVSDELNVAGKVEAKGIATVYIVEGE